MSTFSKMTDFLDRLDASDIHYTLNSVREGAVLVSVTIPGEHWEVEFQKDGDVEVEVFESTGEIGGAKQLPKLFAKQAKA